MRKEDLNEDKFQEFITSVIRAYYHQPRNFYIGGAVLVAAIVAVVLLASNKPQTNPQPNIMFDEAVLVLQDQQRPDTNSAEQILTELSRRFPSNPLGARASYYLGNINYSRGKFEEARRNFERFYSADKRDPLLSPAALMGIGNCYEELGNLDKAADAYASAYNNYSKWALADQAVLAAARCLRQKNRFRDAATILEKYIRNNPKAAADVLTEVKLQLAYMRTLAAAK
jgi:outer membrane protein assembly factor BamD (BamD/ComL family)